MLTTIDAVQHAVEAVAQLQGVYSAANAAALSAITVATRGKVDAVADITSALGSDVEASVSEAANDALGIIAISISLNHADYLKLLAYLGQPEGPHTELRSRLFNLVTG